MGTAVEFSPIQQRRIAAIVGAIVADAAAQPLHWIYKEERMKELMDGVEEIEFRKPSANPFYRIATGKNSCYGDQSFSMLESLVASKGLNVEHLVEETYKTFGPESDYENNENSKYIVGKEDKINIKPTLPIYCPWRHGSLKEFLANYAQKKRPTGATKDDSIDFAVRIVPLVALYAGHPDLLTKVEEGLAVTQCNDICQACALAAARVLEQYILHQNPDDVLQTVIDATSSPQNPQPQELDKAVVGQLRQVHSAKGKDHANAVMNLPGSFQAALHGTVTADGFVDGIRATMRVGGCNASRSGFIGACMAARDGLDSIPDKWKASTLRYQETLQLAQELVAIEI